MGTVAVAIICKTPAPGQSKTRLSPPLRPEECAAISACFIRDLSHTIGDSRMASRAIGDAGGDVVGYAVYTPVGSETALRRCCPRVSCCCRRARAISASACSTASPILLTAGHAGAILVNSDSPTLPPAILRAAVEAVRAGDNVVLSPALDGGYTLIGLSQPHRRLFEDIPWSTATVFQRTLERAAEIGLPVVKVPGWYDVDDAASSAMLEDELARRRAGVVADEGRRRSGDPRFLLERNRAAVRDAARGRQAPLPPP